MHDLRMLSNDQLRKVARAAERETDLIADATRKFIPLYGVDGKITDEVVKREIKLVEEAKEEAKNRGLTGIKSYQFRKDFIQNYSVS